MATLNDCLNIDEANVDTKENIELVVDPNSLCKDTSVNEVNLLFTRANIEAIGDRVSLVDTDEKNKLDMFCYTKCSDDDNSLIKKCRGVVFNNDTLVMGAFPYTTELNNTEVYKINNIVTEFDNWVFYEAHEGALVRMFNFNSKWYISTHRKFNAFNSKWASTESFGSSFKNALTSEAELSEVFRNGLPPGDNILDRFQSTLDTSKQYMFLVRNNKDNRIVCYAPNVPTVYHVGTFVNNELLLNENINLPYPSKKRFDNIEALLDFVNKIPYMDIQGVIGFTSDNKQIKILNKDYQDLFLVRGNEPSVKFRYLQVRMNRRYLNMLYHLYPDMADAFDAYENIIYDIAHVIYLAYVKRFIHKSYVTVPVEEFAVIKECHSWHLSNRLENRISLTQIINVLNKQSPTNINHMIRRFKLENNGKQSKPDINIFKTINNRIEYGKIPQKHLLPSNVKNPK
jgi:hypothetical protein